MDRFWTTTGRASLLAALVLGPVWAQPLAQRKPWLVGLGAVLAALFLLFVLTLLYAIWCSQSRDSHKEEEVGAVREEEKGEGDCELALEEKEGPPSHERGANSSE
ncbi:small integral membrane protein 24-like [Canis lupus baileyi]|uniref:small integral membrane protein 24-like n=1 Tax=Canis lupus dingo TaxID=286419 RepID=UPI000DC667CC|nr:small integral membrane protein 24-like [Canis lupus dingo]XP_038285079.1 small integral membrane protein 24-like [Canis lupus familiaris]XP_038423752.1 small integral membrane protein 24-like [Canis lupus familiaris]